MQTQSTASHSWLCLLGWTLLALLLGFELYSSISNGWWYPDKPTKSGTDFTAFYSAGELARLGGNIYDYTHSSTPRRPYIYPPLFAIFPMAPLSLLPHNAALAVFSLLNLLMLLVTLWLLRKVLWPQAPPQTGITTSMIGSWSEWRNWPLWQRPNTGLILATLVVIRFFHSNQRLGNANMYILLLLSLALFLLVRSRGFLAGAAIALATTFKLTPGLLGLYLLWSRQGCAMLGGAVGLVFCLVLIPGSILGFSQNWTLLSAFKDHVGGKLAATEEAETADANGIIVGWSNALPSHQPEPTGVSLRAAMQRLLSPSVAFPRRPASEDRTFNLLNLSYQQASHVADGLGILLLLITVLLTFPRWASAERDPLMLSLGLATTTMVLISPLTRIAHLVVLLLPVCALIALLQQNQLSGHARRWAWAGILFVGLEGMVFSANLVGQKASEIEQAVGIPTLSILALYVAQAVALRSLRPAKLNK